MGFLVVNSYLASYGVRDIEPIRTRYLAAAVPFAGLAALTMFAAAEIESLAAVAQLSAPRPRRLSRGLAALLRLGLIVIFAALLNFSLLLYLGGVPTASLAEGAGYAVSVIVFTGGVLGVAFNIRGPDTKWRSWLASNASATTVGLAIFTVGAYATTIYPSLPTWLGGGKPDDVELAVTASVSAVCPACAQGATVKLIDEEPTRIVVLVTEASGTRAVEISRSEVHAISHKPRPTKQP